MADSKSVTLTHRQLVVGVIALGLIVGAFFLGRATVSKPTASVIIPHITPTTKPTATTSTVAPTTTTAPASTTTSVAAGPTLATCTNAVTKVYNPGGPRGGAYPFGEGTLSIEQGIGYGCENQEMLSLALQDVVGPVNASGSNLVPNSDVILEAQYVCNNFPQATLCVNG